MTHIVAWEETNGPFMYGVSTHVFADVLLYFIFKFDACGMIIRTYLTLLTLIAQLVNSFCSNSYFLYSLYYYFFLR